jgi:hypothetical protein
MHEPTFSGQSALAGALAVFALVVGLLLAGVLELGREREPGSPSGAIELAEGVPVGVERTPAGAMAAADNYLAVASQSVEQDPAVFAALLIQAYAPQIRSRTLAQAQQIRAGDTQNMSNYAQGGRGIAIIAARRLDSYTPRQATVTSWLGGFVWGPHLSPRQTWNLIDTTLRWQTGRWLVVSSNVDATPAPVPSIVYVDGANNRAAAFQRLAGMTAPFYGTGG